MKAIVVSEKGGPEKLVLREVDDPSPGPTAAACTRWTSR